MRIHRTSRCILIGRMLARWTKGANVQRKRKQLEQGSMVDPPPFLIYILSREEKDATTASYLIK